jgi:hypothetical protein
MVATAVLQHAEENEAVAREVAVRRDASIRFMKARFDRAVGEGERPTETDTDILPASIRLSFKACPRRPVMEHVPSH